MRALLLFAMVLTGWSARADVIDISFGTTGAVVDYTVPITGPYFIRAAGAMGGGVIHEFVQDSSFGGLGAVVGGVVYLTAGEQLGIVAGGQGENGRDCPSTCAGGGGGGSFVFVLGATNPLIAAGGGGGAGEIFVDGGSAQTSTDGQAGFGPYGGSGGTAGAGGAGGTFGVPYNGGGGGGWAGNGGNGGNIGDWAGFGGSGAFTFAGGPLGEIYLTTFGGFGGGGGGGWQGGGGGGGYSGGGGGDGPSGQGGGGGGSYLDVSFTNAMLQAGANAGDGYVDLKLVPEPSSLLMLSTIVLFGAAVTVKRKLLF
jgi:hypothetical protein